MTPYVIVHYLSDNKSIRRPTPSGPPLFSPSWLFAVDYSVGTTPQSLGKLFVLHLSCLRVMQEWWTMQRSFPEGMPSHKAGPFPLRAPRTPLPFPYLLQQKTDAFVSALEDCRPLPYMSLLQSPVPSGSLPRGHNVRVKIFSLFIRQWNR